MNFVAAAAQSDVNLVDISIPNAAVVALLGYAVVFTGLIFLMVVVILLGKAFTARKDSKKSEAPAATAPPVAEVPAAPAAPVAAPVAAPAPLEEAPAQAEAAPAAEPEAEKGPISDDDWDILAKIFRKQ